MIPYILSAQEIYDAYLNVVNGTDYYVFITQVPLSIFCYIMMLLLIFVCICGIIHIIRGY